MRLVPATAFMAPSVTCCGLPTNQILSNIMRRSYRRRAGAARPHMHTGVTALVRQVLGSRFKAALTDPTGMLYILGTKFVVKYGHTKYEI